jgi:hypothetical protein
MDHVVAEEIATITVGAALVAVRAFAALADVATRAAAIARVARGSPEQREGEKWQSHVDGYSIHDRPW